MSLTYVSSVDFLDCFLTPACRSKTRDPMREATDSDLHRREVDMVRVMTTIVVGLIVDGVLEDIGSVPLDDALQSMTITTGDMDDEPHHPVTTVHHQEDMTLIPMTLEDRHHLR